MSARRWNNCMENKLLFINATGTFFLAVAATLVSDMHGIVFMGTGLLTEAVKCGPTVDKVAKHMEIENACKKIDQGIFKSLRDHLAGGGIVPARTKGDQ